MENNKHNKETKSSFKYLVHTILSKTLYIIGTGIILALIAFIYFNFFATKLYTSTTTLYVYSNQNESNTSTDVSASIYLSNDCLALVTTRPVLEQVISELSLDMTCEELESMIVAEIVNNSRLISITVTDSSPIRAKRIADCIAKVSSVRISTVTNTDLVSIWQAGEVPSSPLNKDVMKYTIIGFVLGWVGALVIVVVMFMLKDKISTTEDVERFLKINVIGEIPTYNGTKAKKS